jgi:hypothetical protein
MPAGDDPLAPDHDGDDVVELHGDDRCSPRGRASDDPRAVVTPHEVPGPLLVARIEERDATTSQWVSRAGLNPFVAIAEAAGEPEVLPLVRPTCPLRDDVIDLKWTQDVLLRTSTVPTAIAGLKPNLHSKCP